MQKFKYLILSSWRNDLTINLTIHQDVLTIHKYNIYHWFVGLGLAWLSTAKKKK